MSYRGTRASRRAFLSTTAIASAAVAGYPATSIAQTRRARTAVGTVTGAGLTKANPLADVREIEASLRSYREYRLPFETGEYADRLKRCREAMAKRQIDLLWLTAPEGQCYLHGYESSWYTSNSSRKWMPGTGTAVHVDRDKVIFFGGEDVIPSNATDRRPTSRTGRDGAPAGLVEQLKTEGWLKPGTRVGCEFESYLPSRAVSQKFEAAFTQGGATVVDGSDVMRTIRLVKSPAEIAAIEHAGRLVGIGHQAIVENFRPGITELELYGAIKHAMYAAGSEVPGLDMAIVPAVGLSHWLPSRRQMPAGEPFASDLCGVFKRYHNNACRTYFWGDPPKEMLRLAAASEGAFDLLTRVSKAGTRVSDVGAALRKYYCDQGVWENRWYLGGFEMGIAMQPDWVGEFNWSVSDEADHRVFQENMVLQYESDLESHPGSHASVVSDSILLNINTLLYGKDGARIITPARSGLIVLG